MGLALILENCDFSQNNLGKVTILEDAPVTAINIVANDSYTGTIAQLDVSYTPTTSNQKGVTWSILNGNQYATINSSTGELTILNGADDSVVTVKATSIYDSNISGTKEIILTYKETVDELTAIQISGETNVSATNAQYMIAYTPANSAYIGVTWSIESGGAYASIDSAGLLTVKELANANNVVIKATSTHDATISATKAITVTYQDASTLYINDAETLIQTTPIDTGACVTDAGQDFTIMLKFMGRFPVNNSWGAAGDNYRPYGIFGITNSTGDNSSMWVGIQAAISGVFGCYIGSIWFPSSGVLSALNKQPSRVAFVKEGSTLTLYHMSYNGKLTKTDLGTQTLISTGNVVFGARYAGDNRGADGYYKNMLVTSRAMSESEIVSKFNLL